MSTPRQPQPRAGSGESRAAQLPAPAMALPHGLGLLLLLLLGGPGAAITIPPEYGAHDFLQPPELTEEPPEQLVVFPSDDIVLKCVATGNPPVQYRWSREDQPFVPEEHGGVSVVPGSGTLVINATLAARLQGRFRCFATNALGTAVSPEANVIAENTPQWPKEKVTPVEVEEGDPVVLPCDPPESAVPPKIYWLNSDIVHIAQDERVSMGQDGNLYFSNAMVGDSHPDYICHAHFLGPRTIIQKEPLDLRVAPSNAVRSRRPRLLLPRDPQTTTIALRGGSVVLECIAEGLPTPWVRWRRLNGPLPSRAALENFNKTLRLWGVTESDDGEYECVAENGRGTARGTHSVTVEAAPYWVRRPQSGVFGPGETARLDCEVGGKPRPQIQWSINGVPIDALPGAERRWLRGGALVLPELRPNDSAVLQCEARNRHGRLLANAFLHVVELPVRMLTADEQRYEVVENQTVFLHCRTFGAPAPNVEWLTPTLEPALQDDRSFVFTNGSLRLSAVRGGDGGVYTCMAQNAHSNGSLTALLEVRAPTRISAPPRSATAKKGETVTFHCGATFDPAVTPGELRWLRGGQPLPDDPRYSVAAETLTVSNVDYGDEGTIQCRASTPLDSAEAEAQLRVVGRPGPIRDLQVMEVDEHRVRLSWTPGDDHNSPIEKFVVEEEEGIFSAGRFAERLTVPGGQPWTPPLPLSPYGRFRFRVVAVNAYGRGEHSAPSAPIETPPAAPERNPGGVHGEGNETGNLVITWEPLPPQAWNAPWVRYRVQWRPLEEPGGGGPSGGFPWAESTVDAPPVVVGGLPPFSPFQIRVQAVNGAGKGPEATPGVGHSGEDLPLVYPENVGVELLNSSTVRVRWTLGGGPKELRGRLRGFRVLYWRLGWVGERSRRQAPPDPPQIPQSPAEDPPPFPPVALTVGGDARGALLGGLRPWSRYQLRVLVFNGRGDGPPSEPIAFETPEGVPGPPEELRVERLDDTALSVHWKRPRHLNGVLTGYVLRYQQVEPALGLPQEAPYPPGTLNATLRGLNARSRYRLALRASTRVGSGPALQTVGSTKPEPALPALERVLVSEVGEDFTVLLWSLVQPQEDDVEFEVQFMNKSTDEPWRTSGRANSSLRRYRLEGLRPGTAYRVQFVGRNRSGENVAFWESEVQTNGTVVRSLVGGFATKGWFIGFVSSVVLLLLILLILCFIKRSKGGKYSVKDKEDTQVDSEARPMKDETFGEYRSLESEAEEKGSASGSGAGSGVGSPGRGPCAAGSEDSLAGYGGSGDVQFNEDGSFIGQYRGPGAGPGSSGPASPCAGPPLD